MSFLLFLIFLFVLISSILLFDNDRYFILRIVVDIYDILFRIYF
jgi:hypothetical protein